MLVSFTFISVNNSKLNTSIVIPLRSHHSWLSHEHFQASIIDLHRNYSLIRGTSFITGKEWERQGAYILTSRRQATFWSSLNIILLFSEQQQQQRQQRVGPVVVWLSQRNSYSARRIQFSPRLCCFFTTFRSVLVHFSCICDYRLTHACRCFRE